MAPKQFISINPDIHILMDGNTDCFFFVHFKLLCKNYSKVRVFVILDKCKSKMKTSTHCPACLSVCLPVCLPVCLSVCLPACLSVCLPVCLSVCLSVCLPVCLSEWMNEWMNAAFRLHRASPPFNQCEPTALLSLCLSLSLSLSLSSGILIQPSEPQVELEEEYLSVFFLNSVTWFIICLHFKHTLWHRKCSKLFRNQWKLLVLTPNMTMKWSTCVHQSSVSFINTRFRSFNI